MSRTFRFLIVVGCLLMGLSEAKAFSLLGIQPTWQTLRLGYPDPDPAFGPMNINEEYRWNMPVLTYAMSPNYLSYFGSRGEQEVVKAFELMSALPAASEANLDAFPLNGTRVNDRARALGLLDIKSTVVTITLSMLGLEDPTLYVFTLRKRWVDAAPTTNFVVIKRNFDPVTKQPSSHINGELWTYTGIADGDTSSIVGTTPADPLARNFPLASFAGISAGTYITGLTRDDMGGLRHIYHKNNYNFESSSTNAQLASTITGPIGATSGGGGGSGTAWTPVGSSGAGGGGSAWTPVVINTNTVATNTPGTVNTNFVVLGVRGGAEKITFTRLNFDSVLGTYVGTSMVWTDTVVANGRTTSQRLGRTLTFFPDILIHGADLLGGDSDVPPAPGGMVEAFLSNVQNNGDLTLTGVAPGGAATVGENAGPGLFNSGNLIVFNTVGERFFHVWPFALSETQNAGTALNWGSYDGSTNAPVVYPVGTLVEDIEARVLGGR
jgi:hypothetical protein